MECSFVISNCMMVILKFCSVFFHVRCEHTIFICFRPEITFLKFRHFKGIFGFLTVPDRELLKTLLH